MFPNNNHEWLWENLTLVIPKRWIPPRQLVGTGLGFRASGRFSFVFSASRSKTRVLRGKNTLNKMLLMFIQLPSHFFRGLEPNRWFGGQTRRGFGFIDPLQKPGNLSNPNLNPPIQTTN